MLLGKKRAPAHSPRNLWCRGEEQSPCRLKFDPYLCSLVDDRHAATVLRPGRLVRADHRRTLLAVADRRHAIRRDAERDEHVLHRGGATLAESQVVLARAALVAMAFDRDCHVGVLLKPVGLLLEDLTTLGG